MSGIIRIAKDTFFGGAEKKAGEAIEKSGEKSQEFIRQAKEEAEAKTEQLFAGARQSGLGGFQSALDVFGQTLPQQAQAFQGGNVGAQQALIAGLPQFQNAILGGQVDLSAFQPFQSQPIDFGFAQQQLPQLQNLSAQQPQFPQAPQVQQQTSPLTGIGPSFFNNGFNQIR